MARQISELQSLPFHQMIGGPLLAIVQGQAQASQATVEFIERVGFEKQGDDSSFGSMRMVTFSYTKPDQTGQLREHKIKMPLLSLVPIPAIQVKEAELEMNVKVNDVQVSTTSSHLNSSEAEPGDWLDNSRTEFRTSMGKLENKTEGKSSTDLQLNVKIKIEQADVTAGLSSLYRIMEQGLSSESIPVASLPGFQPANTEPLENKTVQDEQITG